MLYLEGYYRYKLSEVGQNERPTGPVKSSWQGSPTLAKIKSTASLLFEAIATLFSPRKVDPDQISQKTIRNDYISPSTGEWIGRESVYRLDGISDLIASKEAEGASEKEIKDLKEKAGEDSWANCNRFRSAPEEYVPAMINHRSHTIETTKKKVTVSRSGAITDYSNGTTNLRDLKNSGLETELSKRKNILYGQMVQYLKGQVMSQAEKLKNSESAVRQSNTFLIGHVSLLNPGSSKKQGDLTISERNQMIDMAELFKEFNGKQIQFQDDQSKKAPHLSLDESTIYMPISLLGDLSEEQKANLLEQPLTLACAFFNISVQGSSKGREEQNEINNDTYGSFIPNWSLDILNDFVPLKGIKERLDSGESSYELAKDLLQFFDGMGAAIGTNCFSGKDRTGYLLAMMAASYMDEAIDNDPEILSKESEKKQIHREIMSPDGVATRVVYENTGFKVLKNREKRILGMNEDSNPFGWLERIAYAFYGAMAKT